MSSSGSDQNHFEDEQYFQELHSTESIENPFLFTEKLVKCIEVCGGDTTNFE